MHGPAAAGASRAALSKTGRNGENTRMCGSSLEGTMEARFCQSTLGLVVHGQRRYDGSFGIQNLNLLHHPPVLVIENVAV